MFSKLKHWFDGKAKRLDALMLTAALLCGLSGCSKNQTSSSTNNTQSVSQGASQSDLDDISKQASFDIDAVRKSLIIKGKPLELPKRIGDLGEGWSYNKLESHFVDDTGLAEFFYNGEEMFVAGIGDFKEGKEDDGFIFDIALETNDCSIGGITPNVSTKDDVEKKHGEPTKIDNINKEKGTYRYVYGIQDSDHELFKIEHSQMFTVVFYAGNDVVKAVRVVYNTTLLD